MTLSLIRRPEKPLTPDLDSIFTAASSPVVYRFERRDFIISFIGASITDPGFYAVFLAGDHSEELFLGTLVHINGLDSVTGARIFIPTSSILTVVFNGGTNETEISISEPFFGVLGDSGFANNLSRTNYFVEIQLFVTETGREIFQTRLKYFPTVIGIVIVDLSSLVNSFLDPDVPFDAQFFRRPNTVQELGTFNFYISYQERFDGSLTGPVDDSGNPQIATNSVRQILEAGSPNMLPFVPFSQSLAQLFSNFDFSSGFDDWQNGGLGFGIWEAGPGQTGRMQGVGEAVGTVSRAITQDLFRFIGPVIWHEAVYQFNLTVQMDTGENAALIFVDINDDDLQEDFTPGILLDNQGNQIPNRIPISDTFQNLIINYQPGQNATRVGVKVLATVLEPTMTIDIFSLRFNLPRPRFLTREGDLKLWREFPFSISWIYSDLIIGADLSSLEILNDINGNPLDVVIRPIDSDGSLKINSLSINTDLPKNVHSVDVTIGDLLITPDYGPDYVANGWTNEGSIGPAWVFGVLDMVSTALVSSTDVAERPFVTTRGKTYLHELILDTDVEPVSPDLMSVGISMLDDLSVRRTLAFVSSNAAEQLSPTQWRFRIIYEQEFDQNVSGLLGIFCQKVEAQPIEFTVSSYSLLEIAPRILETKRIQVLEPCINPTYLQWVNALGGLDYWMFDYSQEFTNQHIGNRKFTQVLCGAENLTRTEYQAIDWLNHPGQITDLRRVDPDFTLQDKTERRQGTQAYIMDADKSGDKKGIIVEPFISPLTSKNSTHRINIQFILPEQFVTQ